MSDTAPGTSRAAFHEPGHAVFALARGLPLEYVSIEREGASVGRVHNASDLVDAVADAGLRLNAGAATASDRETVETYALFALVGSAAERRFSGGDNLGTADREAVIGFAFRLLDHSVWSAHEWLDSLLSDAREFVETHWEEIELLAAALLQRSTLTSEQAGLVLGDKRR